jgi:hypothetical protein
MAVIPGVLGRQGGGGCHAEPFLPPPPTPYMTPSTQRAENFVDAPPTYLSEDGMVRVTGPFQMIDGTWMTMIEPSLFSIISGSDK